MEQKHGLKKGVLSEIYQAEANVVFMGKRRNILKDIRRIMTQSKASSRES